MGIPKFFRWLSERYPLCSQLVSPHGVPEFDNFYLDMNGIVHVCCRAIATSGQPFTEMEMFTAIFAYVQTLFEKIKPKRVFFLAIDGKTLMPPVAYNLQEWHPEPRSTNRGLDVLGAPKRLPSKRQRRKRPGFSICKLKDSIAIASHQV